MVEAGDMEGLAQAIESLLRMPPDTLRALGERARTRVTEHFDLGKVVEEYEAFYDELLRAGRSRHCKHRAKTLWRSGG